MNPASRQAFHSSTARSSSRKRGFAITGIFHGDNCKSLPLFLDESSTATAVPEQLQSRHSLLASPLQPGYLTFGCYFGKPAPHCRSSSSASPGTLIASAQRLQALASLLHFSPPHQQSSAGALSTAPYSLSTEPGASPSSDCLGMDLVEKPRPKRLIWEGKACDQELVSKVDQNKLRVFLQTALRPLASPTMNAKLGKCSPFMRASEDNSALPRENLSGVPHISALPLGCFFLPTDVCSLLPSAVLISPSYPCVSFLLTAAAYRDGFENSQICVGNRRSRNVYEVQLAFGHPQTLACPDSGLECQDRSPGPRGEFGLF
ncbi:hypothetical protein KSP39_PZI020089 [Platanthera zijinensis]|uniref:Uncharacterized protein n=1 Tax=Platanthera zijinensis TaxID=2320716 RepID=A0AAP0B0N3_9ASPA